MSRYLSAASISSQNLTAQEFFGPYESDLLTILRIRGVEWFNQDLAHLHIDQDVIDDMHDQEEVQERVRYRGAKPYEANMHDMVLWHFVALERRSVVESLLEVDAWIVTLDYGFIRFDHDKRGGKNSARVCLEPSTLVQMLQFWIPSAVSLDEALVGSLRQPLLFLPFDMESEQVTVRILNQLSRYENVNDLEVEVVAEILTNQALRNRLIEVKPDGDIDAEVVHEEMAHIVQNLHNQLRDTQLDHSVIEAARQQAHAERYERERVESAALKQATAFNDERIASQRALDERLSSKESELQEALSLNRELDSKLTKRDVADNRRAAFRRSIRSVVVAVALGIGTALVIALPMNFLGFSSAAWFGSISVGIWISLWRLEAMLPTDKATASSLEKCVQKARRSWWAFVLAVVASIVADVLRQ